MMTHGSLPGLAQPVSRLVMGVDNQTSPAQAAAVFDDYVARGGNTFDTAWIYGAGLQENLFGQWLAARGRRDQVVIIAKGAHSPLCTPEDLSRQLIESLARMQTDHADLYFIHRDNPDVPVGEFVDVLNVHRRAGRIGLFGGSNWPTARVDEANLYARRTGQQGFTLLSNHLSLARMVAPIWAGALSAGDADSRAWLTRTQTPLFAWSSQSRGFFTERADPGQPGRPELVTSCYAEDNFERRARAYALAEKKGVSPTNLAVAWVLHQAFPTYALIGPRTPEQTAESTQSLQVVLTPEEAAWLNLEHERV